LNKSLLMAGIEAKIDAAAALVAIIGTQRYFAQAPENAGTEYLVYHIISEAPSRQWDGKEIWQFRVQFDLYSFSTPTNPATVNAMDAALTTAFDGQTLTITGYTSVSCLKVGGEPTKEENVWRFRQDYMIQAQQS